MCRTYVDDRIDFPCSDLWKDYYFELGQTPFHSPGYASCRDRIDDRLTQLEESIAALADVLRDMAGEPPGQVRAVRGHVCQELLPTPSKRYTRIP